MRDLRILAALLLGAVYIWGLAPSVHIHDAGELTVAAWTLGIGHPPGAPLYMLLLKAFTLLIPLGSIAWRANLFSAGCAVASFFLFEALARRLAKSGWVSLGGALAFSLSLTFWSQAEMAEVYTLQSALLLGFLLTFAKASEEGGGMALPAFMWGLLLSCHMGLSPVTPLVLLILSKPEKTDLTAWIKSAVRLLPYLCLPLLLYAYLPLRSLADPPADWGNPENLQNFVWHFTNRQVRGRMLSLPPEMYLLRLGDYLEILWRNAHILLPLAAIGLWAGWKNARPILTLILLLLASDAGFVILMDNAPLASEAYAIPSVLVLTLLACLGAAAFDGKVPAAACAAALLCAAVISFAYYFRAVDLHENFLVRDAAENILQASPRGSALFVQEDNTTNPLAYLVFAEGARPDLKIYDRFGNFFDSVYDRPLFLFPAVELQQYRRLREEPAVAFLLGEGRPVRFSTPFLDYRPASFNIQARDYSSAAYLPGTCPPADEAPEAAPERVGDHPDWMCRQIEGDLAVKKAKAALETGSYPLALKHLREAERVADIGEMLLLIGQLARGSGDDALALGALDGALVRNPGMAAAKSLKGDILSRMARPEEAEKVLSEAAKSGPELPQPHALLGLQAAKKGQWERARECFTRSLEISPEQPEVLYDRALAALAMGDSGAASKDIRASLALAPKNFRAWVRLASLLTGSGDRAGASGALCSFCQEFSAGNLKPADLKEVLLVSAKAGFPPCVGAWLESGKIGEGDSKKIAEGYLGAQRKVTGASAEVEEQTPR